MFPSARTKNHLLFLLVFVASTVTFHRAVAENIDPAIPCKSSEDCAQFSLAAKDAVCTGGFCACKNGSEMKNCSSAEITQHNRNIGRPIIRGCSINQECMWIANAICNTTIRQCECKKDYVLSTNKKRCLKKAESIDFPCVEDMQCIAFLRNTTCQSGKCSCMPGYHFAESACYITIDFGKFCTRPEECALVEGATCTERSICDCPAGTVVDANKITCLPVAQKILDNCVEDEQCSTSFPGASCIDERCRCKSQYHFESERNECLADKGLGENCGNTYDCYLVGNENVTTKAVKCLKNVCVCADGFDREADKCVNNGGAHHLLETLLPFFVTIILRIVFSGQA